MVDIVGLEDDEDKLDAVRFITHLRKYKKVTLDRQLIHHKSIEEKFGLKILHPMELI